MFGRISGDIEVKAPTTEAWEVYSTLKVVTIIQSEGVNLFGIDVLEGDGGEGTIIKITPHPGESTKSAFKEKFTKVDHENMVKEIEIIGGYLDLGIMFYQITLEFKEKKNDDSSCILRVTVEYEGIEGAGALTIGPLMKTFQAVNKYIENSRC